LILRIAPRLSLREVRELVGLLQERLTNANVVQREQRGEAESKPRSYAAAARSAKDTAAPPAFYKGNDGKVRKLPPARPAKPVKQATASLPAPEPVAPPDARLPKGGHVKEKAGEKEKKKKKKKKKEKQEDGKAPTPTPAQDSPPAPPAAQQAEAKKAMVPDPDAPPPPKKAAMEVSPPASQAKKASPPAPPVSQQPQPPARSRSRRAPHFVLSLRPVRGDGNCCFRALALAHYGDEGLHTLARQIVVDEMARDPTHWASVVDARDFGEYLRTMSLPANGAGDSARWGDAVCVRAFARALNIAACLVRSDRRILPLEPEKCRGVRAHHFTNPDLGPSALTVFVRHSGNHYDALVVSKAQPNSCHSCGYPGHFAAQCRSVPSAPAHEVIQPAEKRSVAQRSDSFRAATAPRGLAADDSLFAANSEIAAPAPATPVRTRATSPQMFVDGEACDVPLAISEAANTAEMVEVSSQDSPFRASSPQPLPPNPQRSPVSRRPSFAGALRGGRGGGTPTRPGTPSRAEVLRGTLSQMEAAIHQTAQNEQNEGCAPKAQSGETGAAGPLSP